MKNLKLIRDLKNYLEDTHEGEWIQTGFCDRPECALIKRALKALTKK